MSKYSSDTDSSSGASPRRKSRPKSSKLQVKSSSSSSSDSHHSYKKKSHKSRHKHGREVHSRSHSKTSHSKVKHSGHSSRTVDRVRSRSSSKSRSSKSSRNKNRTSNSRERNRSESSHRSRSRRHSRSRSVERSNVRSKSSSQESRSPNLRLHSGTIPQEPSTQEQLHAKLQKAIKAAQTADNQLRQQGLLSSTVIARKGDDTELSISKPTGSVLDEINDSSFVPKHFTSSKSSSRDVDIPVVDLTGGDVRISLPLPVPCNLDEPGSIFHSSLFVPKEQKIDKWVRKLFHLRQKAINGEPILSS